MDFIDCHWFYVELGLKWDYLKIVTYFDHLGLLCAGFDMLGPVRVWWTAGLWSPNRTLVGNVSESHVLLLCTLPAMLYCGHDVYRYHAYFIACHAYWCPCQCQPCLFHAQYAFINSLFLYSPCTTLLYITDVYLWLLLKTYHIDAGILDVYCMYD